MRKFFSAMVGAILGFFVGALVGTLCGMLWIWVFPPDRVTGGPEAGFNTVFGTGLAGEVIGTVAGIVLALRRNATKPKL